jgi:hypothetical protein
MLDVGVMHMGWGVIVRLENMRENKRFKER